MRLSYKLKDNIKNAKECVSRIEKLLPGIKRCLADGNYPIYIKDLTDESLLLSLLAAKNATLQEIVLNEELEQSEHE